MAEIDWAALKMEYVTTDISIRKLAEKHSISRGQICRYCANEGWVEARDKYRAKVVSKASQKVCDTEANRLAKLMASTHMAVDVAMNALEDKEQFNRYIVTENVGGGATETTERIYAKVDTKALKELTGVIKDLTGLMRDFYNIPTPAQAEAQRIAAERFELEKKRAAADDNEDKVIEIVMSADMEEFCK